MTAQFEKNIKDPNLPVISDLSHPGRPVLIAFGGIVSSLGIPPFEFFKLTKDQNVNKIYLRDLSQTWYHAGLPGISGNIDETASFLKCKIKESAADRVVIFGNSMGGYAALIFGILLGADIVHAFSPHTSLADVRLIRSKKKIQKVHKYFPATYFDVPELFSRRGATGTFHLYFDARDALDEQHAMHVKNYPHVTLHAFSGGGHGLIKVLKESGELQDIINSSLDTATDVRSGKSPGSYRQSPSRITMSPVS